MHSPIPYDYRRRFTESRELHALQFEVKKLKTKLTQQSILLIEKDTLLSKKDTLLFKKDTEIKELKELQTEAYKEINKAIKLKTSIRDKNKKISELLTLCEESAAEKARLESRLAEMIKHVQQPPKPKIKCNQWDPADVEFLKNFDFASTRYIPDKPKYQVRKVKGVRRMCIDFVNGNCPRGQSCKFGHSTKELIPFLMNNYKMKPCARAGYCSSGKLCHFRHGEIRRKLLDDFYLVFGGVLDAPRVCFYASQLVTEDRFKRFLHEVLDRLERVLPKRLLPVQVVHSNS